MVVPTPRRSRALEPTEATSKRNTMVGLGDERVTVVLIRDVMKVVAEPDVVRGAPSVAKKLPFQYNGEIVPVLAASSRPNNVVDTTNCVCGDVHEQRSKIDGPTKAPDSCAAKITCEPALKTYIPPVFKWR